MKVGDIVWTEAHGHISKWVVVKLEDGHGFIRLYHIQEEGEDVDGDHFFNAKEEAILATEAEAIRGAIKQENLEFESCLHSHNEFMERMSKRLGQIKRKRGIR